MVKVIELIKTIKEHTKYKEEHRYIVRDYTKITLIWYIKNCKPDLYQIEFIKNNTIKFNNLLNPEYMPFLSIRYFIKRNKSGNLKNEKINNRYNL